MLWIMTLILFICFLCLYFYFFYTRKLNNKLNKKRKSVQKVPRLNQNFSTNCRITFVLCLFLFIMTGIFFVNPHTNGGIKEIASRENLINLYEKHYDNSSSESIENVKTVASSIKNNKNSQSKIDINDDFYIYIENNTLYLKTTFGEKLTYEYSYLPEDCNVKLFKNHILVYYADGEASILYIHDFNTLELKEKTEIDGIVDSVTVRDGKIYIAIKHTYKENTPLLKGTLSCGEYYLNLEDMYYVPNCDFYQNLTIVCLENSLESTMYSLFIGDYYLIESKSGMMIASSDLKEDGKHKTTVYFYDYTLGLTTRIINLKGYVYTQIEKNKSDVTIHTVEESDDIKVFRQYIIDLNLYTTKTEEILVDGENKGIAMQVDNDIVYAEVEENTLKLAMGENHTLDIDLSVYSLERINKNLYLISENEKKIIEKIETSVDGFEIVEVFSYEKFVNYTLLATFSDGIDHFIFHNSTEIALVSIKENSFEITKVYSSEIEFTSIEIINDEIVIIEEEKVIIYCLNDKTIKKITQDEKAALESAE